MDQSGALREIVAFEGFLSIFDRSLASVCPVAGLLAMEAVRPIQIVLQDGVLNVLNVAEAELQFRIVQFDTLSSLFVCFDYHPPVVVLQ